MERELGIKEARGNFAELVNQVAYAKQHVVLVRHGKPVAAMVPIEDMELLEELEDKLDLKLARKRLEEAKGQKNIPLEDIRAKLNL